MRELYSKIKWHFFRTRRTTTTTTTTTIIFYPRVYNARGLKTERIKTAEMIKGTECHQ